VMRQHGAETRWHRGEQTAGAAPGVGSMDEGSTRRGVSGRSGDGVRIPISTCLICRTTALLLSILVSFIMNFCRWPRSRVRSVLTLEDVLTHPTYLAWLPPEVPGPTKQL